MMRRLFASLMAVSAVSALLTLAPPTAHAIPVAGDYVWDGGQPITGSFTSNGSQLTKWNVTVAGINFQDPNQGTNAWHAFTDYDIATGTSLIIVWNDPAPNGHSLQLMNNTGTVLFTQLVTLSAVSNVPEPTALLQLALGLGLLALVGTVTRQRRLAGL